MRLTLLWSQCTTGNYFEEESALSIGFHCFEYQNLWPKTSSSIRCVELAYIKQQNQTCAPYAPSVSLAKHKPGKVKHFESTDKYDTVFVQSEMCFKLSLT